jgi:hypothetical protein
LLNPPGSFLLVLFVNLDLVGILADPRMHRLFNQLAASASDLQNQIVERRTAQDVDVIRCAYVSNFLSLSPYIFI